MADAKLILVVGLSGTGKSTFSRALAERLEARHLNSDVIRADLGLRGDYSAAGKATVYGALRLEAEALLNTGATVIVDATLYREVLRNPYSELAHLLGCPVVWIELQAREEIIKDRVSQKRTYSEADLAAYRKIRALYEPLTTPHLSLNTDNTPLGELVSLADRYIRHEAATP